jgi:cold shock protein
METTQREQGTVKFFNPHKGWGFILRENGDSVFVHHTAIIADGYRTLLENEPVEFEIVQSPKGVMAREVARLNPPTNAIPLLAKNVTVVYNRDED